MAKPHVTVKSPSESAEHPDQRRQAEAQGRVVQACYRTCSFGRLFSACLSVVPLEAYRAHRAS